MAHPRRTIFVVPAILSVVIACSSTQTINAGSTCDDPNDLCVSGTTCLTESLTVLEGCSSTEKICTITCTTDDVCTALLGAGAQCSDACDPSFQNVCVPP